MMKLEYSHLADFASQDKAGKINVLGIFNIIYDRRNTVPIEFPACYLVSSFTGSVADGSDHSLAIRMVDADDQDLLINPIVVGLRFTAQGPGYPTKAGFVIGFDHGALRVKKRGDYCFIFAIDGAEIDRLDVHVLEPPPGK